MTLMSARNLLSLLSAPRRILFECSRRKKGERCATVVILSDVLGVASPKTLTLVQVLVQEHFILPPGRLHMSIPRRSLEIIDLSEKTSTIMFQPISPICKPKATLTHLRESTIVKQVFHYNEVHLVDFGLSRSGI